MAFDAEQLIILSRLGNRKIPGADGKTPIGGSMRVSIPHRLVDFAKEKPRNKEAKWRERSETHIVLVVSSVGGS